MIFIFQAMIQASNDFNEILGLTLIHSFLWILFIFCFFKSIAIFNHIFFILFSHAYIQFLFSWFWSSKCSDFFLDHDWLLAIHNFIAWCRSFLDWWFIQILFVNRNLFQFIPQSLFAWTLDFCELFSLIVPVEIYSWITFVVTT